MDKGYYSHALYRDDGEGQHDWHGMLVPELECVAWMRNERHAALETKVAQAKKAAALKMETLRSEPAQRLMKTRPAKPSLGRRYRCQTGCLMCVEPPPTLGARINVTW